jgi:pyrimidine oxygenase
MEEPVEPLVAWLSARLEIPVAAFAEYASRTQTMTDHDDMLREYTAILRERWTRGRSDFKGQFYRMNDCRLSPPPSGYVPLVCAGQSPRGMKFVVEFADYNFCVAAGMNTPAAYAGTSALLLDEVAKTSREVGSYPLFMVIADETDEAAFAKWRLYQAGADVDALAYLGLQAGADLTAGEDSTARWMTQATSPVNFNMGTLVGSYANVAHMRDEASSVAGTKEIMLTFDDLSSEWSSTGNVSSR